MGGSIAPSYSSLKTVGCEPQVGTMVGLVMPLYYTKDQITREEVAVLKDVWTLIEGNQSQFFSEFQEKLRLAGVKPPELCSEYLLNTWVNRLLDVHPQAKPIFEKIDLTKMRIHFTSMMTLLINCVLDDPAQFRSIIERLVKSHGLLGVRSCECKLKVQFSLSFDSYVDVIISWHWS